MKLKTKIKLAGVTIALFPIITFGLAIRFSTMSTLRGIIMNLIIIDFAIDAVLMVWIYCSIYGPLKQLREATRKIRDGNLDFELSYDKQDEYGALFDDFEQMRVRLKESAEEKIRVDEENREMISNISHDLKTPLTAIQGYVEGIMDGVADTPEKMDRYIRIIYTKTHELNQLLGELTVYSQLDTNKIPFHFQKINVARYFEDCVDEITMDLEQRGITVSYENELPEDTVMIADPEQFSRAIHNIVTNSIKYMDKKNGTMNIRLKDEGDFIHMEFEDSGKGIAAKDLPFIFDRFYRTDSSRNSSQGGSGIGLSVVQKITEAHGGRVWATSREGEGTTIHFSFRKYVETILEQDETSDEKPAGKAGGRKSDKKAEKRAEKKAEKNA
ncbi:MAG: HAMP domain-containing histidine kinase [Lachnospiraceae bacterium]|nr:HAMP domain-containing histidine kinase [Lachnospiraceae bacterium]